MAVTCHLTQAGQYPASLSSGHSGSQKTLPSAAVPVLLPSMTLHGMGYPLGEFGSAVPVPHCGVRGILRKREGCDAAQALLSNSRNTAVLSTVSATKPEHTTPGAALLSPSQTQYRSILCVHVHNICFCQAYLDVT